MIFSNAWAIRPYTPVHPDPVLEPWRWRSFPELNGLGLLCMAEAKDKEMWFGVNDGVRRYDGVKWTAYTEKDGLYGAPVQALCATRDGSVYAGTPMGISRFEEGKWRRVFPPAGDLPWIIGDLMEARDGSVWAGTAWGALRLGHQGATLYTTETIGSALRTLAPDVRLSIVPGEAAPARVWREGIGVAMWSFYFNVRAPNVVCVLAPDGPGEVAGLKVGDRIVAVDGQSLIRQGRLDGPAGASVKLRVKREGRSEPFEVTIARKKVEGIYRGFSIYDVYEDREGRMWFGIGGLDGGEIVCYTPSASVATPHSEWRLYTEKDGLDIGWGPRIAQTRDGTIWTASLNGLKGVNRFDGKTWTHFTLRKLGGGDANPSVMETRDGTLWIGGDYGCLYVYRKGVWGGYKTPDVPIPGRYIIGLLEASDGALWVAGLGQEAVRLDYGTSRWTTCEGLIFQCETPDGAQWFLSQDNGVVRYDGRGWTRYGVEDGLMDSPVALTATRQGVLWAAGSQDSTAATARFDGNRWSLQTHPRLSWGISPFGIYESSDGSLWFGAYINPFSERGQVGGVLRFDGKVWTHYTPPEALPYVYGIGQTADGILWFGSVNGLRRFDGRTWTPVTDLEEFTTSSIDAVYSTLNGDLWVGTRNYGLFHYEPSTISGQVRKAQVGWTRYDVRDGLADNAVTRILQTGDGSIWVVTPKGTSRSDPLTLRQAQASGQGGRPWTTYALPSNLRIEREGLGSLQQSRDGALWINQTSGSWVVRAMPGFSARKRATASLRTTRYQPDTVPPHTEITVSLNRVSQPGNTALAWTGADPWKATPDEEVQYSYRMDGGEWSPFSTEKNKVFLALSSGAHTFEVRARDRDFNVDPTPAAIRFTVVPPVWRQPWFLGLMAVLLGAVGLQTARVVRRDRRLQESNMALSAGNKELFALNRALQQKTEDLEKANAQIQEANRQAQEATERKSRFLASMSHELRTPMNAIIGFTRLVLRRAGDLLPERQRENLVKVKASADHLLNLINDILDLSKIEAGRVDIQAKPFDVKALIASCCETVSPLVKPGVALNYEVTDGVGEAHTDEAKLRQVVINLLSNALKFTEQGEVRVSVKAPTPALPAGGEGARVPPSTGGLQGGPKFLEDKTLEIAVSDTGVGIPPEALGYIFEEFRQVAGAHQTQKGTGLGLSITKKLTELLDGTIEVSSEAGKGSVFTVRIPVVYQGN